MTLGKKSSYGALRVEIPLSADVQINIYYFKSKILHY